MGKASKWFRGLLGLKKPDSSSSSANPNPDPPGKPPRRKWSFGKSSREKVQQNQPSVQIQRHHSSLAAFDKSQHGPSSAQFSGSGDGGIDPNKHAIAVAAATAAVAEAAVKAAHAAAAVVKLTNSGRVISTTSAANASASTSRDCAVNADASVCGGLGFGNREEWAAVKIQSHFRAYLSRRALRALKALVKLQALVRGHIVRKQTAETLRSLQVLLRAQARARAGRAYVHDSPLSSIKSKHFHFPGPATPEKSEHGRCTSVKREDSLISKRDVLRSTAKVVGKERRAHIGYEKMDCRVDARSGEQGSSARSGPVDDGRSDKIVEIDTGKPYITPKRRNLFHSSHLSLNSDQYGHSLSTSDSVAHQTAPSPSSGEVQSQCQLYFADDMDGNFFDAAQHSPQYYSASSKGGNSSSRGPFTPTKSDGTRSCLSGYSDYPSYMAFTESSKAKVRSLSAPKLRPQYERSASAKRYSLHSYGESRANNTQRISALHSNFASKAYPGSGRLDRLGMPVRGDGISFSGGLLNRG